MTFFARRLTFQLTPLLDLLLIVIFAQYMEMQQASRRSEAALEERRTQLAQRLEAQFQAREAELERRRQKYEEDFRSILDQQKRTGDILTDLFNIPQQVTEQILKLNNPDRVPPAIQVAELKKTLQKLQATGGRDMLQALIDYGEMQKRCDLWTLYVADDGFLEVSDGQVIRRFRAESTPQIENELFQACKSFADPKTLVVLLVSWGDARFDIRERTRQALPATVTRLREDSGGHNWFEYAVLGFSPSGPATRTPDQ